MQNSFFWMNPIYTENQKYCHSCPDFPETMKFASKDQFASFQALKVKCDNLEIENQQLKQEITELKDRKSRKRKVSRRSEDELDKCFSCPYENCKKEYASSLALNLHMKTKHNAGTKKQRDNYAELILKAEKEGTHLPKCDIQLPPNYLQKYRLQKTKGARNLVEDEDEDYEYPEELYKQMEQQS